MRKWLRRLLGKQEREKSICFIIYVAPDADILAECRRRETERSYIRLNQLHEEKRKSIELEERRRQFREWVENNRALDELTRRQQQKQQRNHLRLIV